MSIFTNPGKVLAEDWSDIEGAFTADVWPLIKGVLAAIEGSAISDAKSDAVTALTQLGQGTPAGTVAANLVVAGVAQGIQLGQQAAAAAAVQIEQPPAA